VNKREFDLKFIYNEGFLLSWPPKFPSPSHSLCVSTNLLRGARVVGLSIWVNVVGSAWVGGVVGKGGWSGDIAEAP